MSAKFTPGPWQARDSELIGGDGTILATLHWHSGRDVENVADARLIAAAPEMYEALKAFAAFEHARPWPGTAWENNPDGDVLFSHHTGISVTREDFRRAAEALAKAEGRS